MTYNKKIIFSWEEVNGNNYDPWCRELVKQGKAVAAPREEKLANFYRRQNGCFKETYARRA